MFFKPTLSPSSHTGSEYELYSDWHKEAFGCRPGRAQSARYNAMSPEERQAEHATVSAWFDEDQRIMELRTEVARFDFSRRMEYLMRREGISRFEAFKQTCSRDQVECLGDDYGFDWGYVCYTWGLPYSDEAVLKAEWDRLKEGAE